jgi:hypothetical protein
VLLVHILDMERHHAQIVTTDYTKMKKDREDAKRAESASLQRITVQKRNVLIVLLETFRPTVDRITATPNVLSERSLAQVLQDAQIATTANTNLK